SMINRKIFWGSIFIIVGISYFVPFPVKRIILGLILCYIGINIIFKNQINSFQKKKNKNNLFNINDIKCEKETDYNILFGSSDIVIDNDSKNCEINVVFGSASISILTERPVELKVSCVFSSVALPHGKRLSFGENIYNFSGEGEVLKVKLATVFSSSEIGKI
ncbi:MAG: hypothetical protein JXM74_06760, partial [Fusobacteriaceae bacterium]|nr:hypothetical protein [Fusobacteriaceae bacterium]